MLIKNRNKKYFIDLFDQEKHLSIYFDREDQKINYKLNYFKKSLNSSLKEAIIKASKTNSLARTKIINHYKNNQGSLTTINGCFIAAKTDRTSKAKISLSETAQALVKRMPIDQLMIGFLRGFVRMGVTYTHTNKMLGFKSCLAGSPLTSVLGLSVIHIQGEFNYG